MKFIYQPEGAEPRSWEYDPMRMKSTEVEAIEEKTGILFGDWGDRFKSMRFLHGLLWAFLRRDMPDLDYEAVVFDFSELDFEDDDQGEGDPEDPKDSPSASAESGTGDLS